MFALHVFDFDGTLFRSPDTPDWWPGRTDWYLHPASLGSPCVPQIPGEAYWIQPTVHAARRSIAHSGVVTALITGRVAASFAGDRVPELLTQQGLAFDEVHLSTSTDTAAFKMTVMRTLLAKHPTIQQVHIWEDHTKNLARYIQMVEALGCEGIPHVVQESPMSAACPEFTHHTERLARRMLRASLQRLAAGTAKDITDHLRFFEGARQDLEATVKDGLERKLSGDSSTVRKWAKGPWTALMDRGFRVVEGILSTRSIPPRHAKGVEMAYRLFANSARVPKDIYKWWATNQKRIDLVIEAAHRWPEKQEGTDELFTVGSFRVHNTVGATGSDLESLKKILATVEKLAWKNPVPGFSRTVYGDIHVVSRITKGHHGAWYYPSDDSLYLRQAKKVGMDEVRMLIHELGHRYWTKFASKSAIAEWTRHHERVGDKEVDVDLPGVGEPIPVKVSGMKTDPIVTKMEKGKYFFEAPMGGKVRTFTIDIARIYEALAKKQRLIKNYPTPYSTKDEEEHFCEALSLKAMGALTDEHEVPFDAIWS